MNDSKLERQINDAASDAISKIEELEETIEALNSENDGLRDEISDKDDQISELEGEIEELKEQLKGNSILLETVEKEASKLNQYVQYETY